MCSRIAYICKNTFKKGTACCDLLTIIGKIVLVLGCIVAGYFLFVGIGQLETMIAGIWCASDINNSEACKFFYKQNHENPFGSGFMMGILVCASIVTSGGICFGVIQCLKCTFNRPLNEFIYIWNKSANPEYEPVVIDQTGYDSIKLVVNTNEAV